MTISRRTFALPMLCMAMLPLTAMAQDFTPQRQVTFVAVAGAGGGLDTLARTIAKQLEQKKLVAQPMTVENKPGGGQVTGTVQFATQEAKNDHKLMIASTPFILNHIKKAGNSPIGPDDIYPLAMLQVDFGIIAVRADSKFKTLKEVVDAIKSNPTSVQLIGGGAPGTWDYLNSILIVKNAGVDIKSVKYNAYDGGGEALTALLGGHGDVLTSDVSSIKQYLQAGKVRVLGVSSGARLADDEVMKGVPTYKEQGYNVETANWRGIFMGKDASPASKKYWGEKMGQITATPEWKEELKKQGVVSVYRDAKGFYDLLKADQASFTSVYNDLGMAK
jgi:putative tricarboxylic transport membrane protein